MKSEAHAPSQALLSSPPSFSTPHRRGSTGPLTSGPPSVPSIQYLADRAPSVALVAFGQAWREEHLLGVSWIAHPPSPHSPQSPPSVPALRAAAAQAPRKGVCLPGNPSPCNRVSRDTARDALTSATKARSSPPAAGTAPRRADRRGGGLATGRIAPPLTGKGSQKHAGEAGVGDTDHFHMVVVPPFPHQHQGVQHLWQVLAVHGGRAGGPAPASKGPSRSQGRR